MANINGTAGNDILQGTVERDFIQGFDGNDTIYSGLGGDDNLQGGAGNDVLIVEYAPGKRVSIAATGQDGIDTIILDLAQAQEPKGIEMDGSGLTLGSYYVGLSSSIEQYQITGTQRDDLIRGGVGNDILKGLAGNDRFFSNGGVDVFEGSEGIDELIIDLSSIATNQSVSNAAGGTLANGSTFSGIEVFNLKTGNGDDQIELIGDFNDELVTNAGNDTIKSGGGNDKVLAGDGNDTVFAGTGDDDISGEGGDDTLEAGFGNDTLTGGTGNDRLIFSYAPGEQRDSVNAGDGIDTVVVDFSQASSGSGLVYAGFGISLENYYFQFGSNNVERFELTGTNQADELQGGQLGGNVLKGGAGNDSYLLRAENVAGTRIQDSSGTDRLSFVSNVNVSLATARSGIIGLQKVGNDLIIDVSQDGAIDPAQDLTLLDFFNGDTAGAGLIEQVGTLSGDQILSLFRPAAPVRTEADFNSDGKADVVWRNHDSGETALWLMDGTNVSEGRLLLPNVDRNWKIAGIGDFAGDRTPDLLMRNQITGENAFWSINGATLEVSASTLTVGDQSWQISATGDFNGDGKTDIAWRNRQSGLNAVWLMDGANIASGTLTTPVQDLNWMMVGGGDFNGDRKADIVWRNRVTGENAVWLMDGAAVTSGSYLLSVPDQNWQIGQTGDFNGDGQTDLAWRNNASGANALWLMNRAEIAQGSLIPSVSSQSWNMTMNRAPLSI